MSKIFEKSEFNTGIHISIWQMENHYVQTRNLSMIKNGYSMLK